jgi:sigma-E factor negative regulatory protein RseB
VRRLVPVAGAVLVLGPLAVLAFLVAPEHSGTPPDTSGGTGPVRDSGTPLVQSEARRLLARAAQVPGTTAYHGVQFVSAWSAHTTTSEVVDVDHDPGHGTTVHTDGTTSVPAHSLTVLAGGTPSIAAGGAVGVLAAHYSLTVVGTDRVAGRDADVVAARRPDARRGDPDAARFWLDRASGLVLRREVYDRRGRTIRASAFVEVTVGQPGTAAGAGNGGPAAKSWSATLDPAAVRTMRRNGWHCPEQLPGPLSLVDARRAGGRPDSGTGIVHLSYSDGIATVSLFEQRGRLADDGPPGHDRAVVGGHEVWVRGDLPRRVVWASDGTVYTLVADAPERTVEGVVAALPHRATADDGTLGRLGRGLDRVASWFNPFA